jgi:hypothetical protein
VLRERGCVIDQQLLAHLSPLTWEHINLTGDYHWRRDGGLQHFELVQRQAAQTAVIGMFDFALHAKGGADDAGATGAFSRTMPACLLASSTFLAVQP